MSEEIPTPETQEIDDFIDDRSESEIEYDRQMDRLDSFFSNLDPGVTLLIQRIQPSWCKGVLEEITVGDDEINLDYFIENWGGHLLLVKVRGNRGRMKGNYRIPLYSYPPLVFGKRLKYNDKSERFLDEPESPTPNPTQTSPVVVTQSSGIEKIVQILPTVLPLVSEMMRANEARRQADMAMILQIMKSQNGSGLSDITKIGTVMSQLSEMFRNQSSDVSNSGDMDFMGNALEVIKTVFNKPETNTRQEHKLIPPKTSPVPNGPPITPVTSIKSAAPQNVAQTISDMEPRQAADTIIEAMLRMPSGKREEAIGNFITQYQEDMGNDSDEDGDNYVEELRGRKR